MESLFDEGTGQVDERPPADAPLAARMRPRDLEGYAGQEHLLAEGTALRSAIDGGHPHSMILHGPPGSGKTTLCSIAGGILSPTSGRVVVEGNDISGYSPRQLTDFRREAVGFVFQTVNLIPFLTARENLLVVDEIGKRDRKRAAARADQLLDELGLTDRASNLPSELSGGQKQRVAIGRALMNEPALVMFDEPTSALGTKLGEQTVGLIRDEMKSRGTAAIIVTHDDRITRYADRTVRITDGRLES